MNSYDLWRNDAETKRIRTICGVSTQKAISIRTICGVTTQKTIWIRTVCDVTTQTTIWTRMICNVTTQKTICLRTMCDVTMQKTKCKCTICDIDAENHLNAHESYRNLLGIQQKSYRNQIEILWTYDRHSIKV